MADTTIRDIIDRACRVVNITGTGQSAAGEDAAEALEHLNAMMHGLGEKGATLEWEDKALNDDCPWGKGLNDLVIHALANRLQSSMGEFPVDQDLQLRLKNAEGTLVSKFTTYPPVRADYY